MKKNKFVFWIFFTTVLFLQPVTAFSVTIIPGVTASTDMGWLYEKTTPDKMVDGSGLIGGSLFSFDGQHDSSDDTGWKSPVGTTSGTITFDFHGLYLLDSFGVWNHAQIYGERGVRNVSVFISTNGSTFTPLAGGPTQFAKAYPEPVYAQVFDFDDILASYVRFNIIDGYSAVGTHNIHNVGLSEVRFSGIQVPEPATMLLLGLGLVGLAGMRKKIKK